MHRFLTAFLCLSTLAMAQNVVAGTPRPMRAEEGRALIQAPSAHVLASGVEMTQASIGGSVPTPGTMLLFVTGLAGLSAVGRPRKAPTLIARP